MRIHSLINGEAVRCSGDENGVNTLMENTIDRSV